MTAREWFLFARGRFGSPIPPGPMVRRRPRY